jgi:leader peptidase (prepilin peptidase) / N-methyltransferase
VAANALQMVLLVFSIVFGAVVGSFLNVCIYRLPWEKSLLWPGSHCPACARPVRAYDNIPILSWFILRGRCRHCGEQFSARYMLVELMTAALFGTLFWLMAPAGIADFARCVCYAFLLGGLIVATFIDLDLQIIPDSVTVPGMLVGLIGSTLLPQVPLVLVTDLSPALPMNLATLCVYTADVLAAWGLCVTGIVLMLRRREDQPGAAEWVILVAGATYLLAQSFSVLDGWGLIGAGWQGWQNWFGQHPHGQGFWTGIVGMLTGAGLIWIVRVVGSAAMRREAMGFGDVTLMAMVGAFLGWQATVCVFFIAPFMGLCVGLVQWMLRGDNVLPYGPYLSLASVVTLLAWPQIWPVLGPRLGILGLLGFVCWGIALLVFFPILLYCLRINSQASNRVPDDGARAVEGNA